VILIGKVKSKRALGRERLKGGKDKLGKAISKRILGRDRSKGGKGICIITWIIVIIGFIILYVILFYFMG